MTVRPLTFGAAMVLLLVVLANYGSVKARGAPEIVSGHTVLLVSGAERTFDFTAIKHEDGSVIGQARLNNEANGLQIVLALDCLEIVGNLAKVGGKVIQADAAILGANVIFHAEDNGDAPGDPADRISFGFITGASCSAFVIPPAHPGRLTDIVRGFVRVRD